MHRWITLCTLITVYGLLWTAGAMAQHVIVVQENDTVWSLAKRYRVLPQDIVKANHLKNPDSLKPGIRLRIPAAVKPMVAPATMRKTGVINKDRVCIRYAPGRTDRSITLLDKGHPVVVTARRGNWLQVKLSTGRTGWVRSDLVTVTGTFAMKPSASAGRKVAKRITAAPERKKDSPKRVAVRRRASTRVANREWTTNASSGDSIVRLASRYKGVRYRWGGSSRSGFDCSGFTRYVFRQKTGIELPHSASAQFRRGTPVSRDELQPGDLVFFQTYRRGASHVGIYIGNGKFIHASSAGRRVQIDSLNEGYYRQRYLGARRVTR
ncbi:MAG: NlpC/P60 family protein [Armatimonadota bacterium]|nr:NlpC/P60 family protein [bacterium]MDW8322317.1 NlpC/P60 family protein [Armatimonadota bacterium]